MERRFGKKNVVVIAVLCGAIVLGAVYMTKGRSNGGAEGPVLAVNEYQSRENLDKSASLDSDGDGLRDWEEVLLKTNPDNPDTDGDGTSDSDEVRANRDPLTPGPDDAASHTAGGIDPKDVEALPETDKLAFKLFEGYVDLKQRGYLGTSIEQNFVSSLIEDNVSPITTTTYTTEDVRTSLDVTPAAYNGALRGAWAPLFNVTEDELVTFTRIIDSGDEGGFEKLRYAKEQYETTVANLENVVAPPDAASIHADMLSAFNFFATVLETMATVNNDPLIALTAISGYTDGEAKMQAALERLNTYLLVNDVIQ